MPPPPCASPGSSSGIRTGRLGLLLGGPLAWFLLVYIGSLVVLFLSAFWSVDVFTGETVHNWGLQNFQTLLNGDVYRTITLRTVGMAAAVTLTDIVLAFPLAYYAARLATPRRRNAILVAVIIPLWANYLVRVFSWKLILSPTGLLNWTVEKLGIGSLQIANSGWAIWLTFSYLWLPFTLLPIYGALERVSPSFLEASSDLGGQGVDDVPAGRLPADRARDRRRRRSSRSRSRSATTSCRAWSATRSSSAT